MPGIAIRSSVGAAATRPVQRDRSSGWLRQSALGRCSTRQVGFVRGSRANGRRPQPWVVGPRRHRTAPSRRDDLGVDLGEGAKKVRNSMVSRRRRCSSWRSAQRGLTGSNRAHHALRFQARACRPSWLGWARPPVCSASTWSSTSGCGSNGTPQVASLPLPWTHRGAPSIGGPISAPIWTRRSGVPRARIVPPLG